MPQKPKRPSIGVSLKGVRFKGTPTRSSIDIPLPGDRSARGRGAANIKDGELEFVNRHHQAVKAQRRRKER